MSHQKNNTNEIHSSASGKRNLPLTDRITDQNDVLELVHSIGGSDRRKRDTKEHGAMSTLISEFDSTNEEVKVCSSTLLKSKARDQAVTQKDGQFSLYPELTNQTVKTLVSKGINDLFPIQQHCFRPIYNREDVIARDLTGSGKTLAFALPIVEYLRKESLLGSRKIQAIVLAPTRELAIQVTNTFQYLKHSPSEYNAMTVYGGVSIDDQTRQLRSGVEIFVGTTGRVLDHIERGNIDFSHIKTIVLDEADQMLKLGFKEDIERILSTVRQQQGRDLQICLFSATVPGWVRDVANQHMKRSLRVVDLVQDLKNKTARKVQHLAIYCPFHNRIAALADVLVLYGGVGKTIVFTQTKVDANSLMLSDRIKLDMEVMHGDIAQNQREVTMKRFKDGKFRVLVATDVASRGLDVPNVDLVVQIEPPNEVETYIHRSGRTARAGASGICVTFYTDKTRGLIDQIESQAGIKLQRVGIPQHDEVIKASATGMLESLDVVSDDVLPMFEEAAKKLMEKQKGNALAAIAKTLAFISGHHTKGSKQKDSQNLEFCDDYQGNDRDRHVSERSVRGVQGGRGGGRGGRGSYNGNGGQNNQQRSYYNEEYEQRQVSSYNGNGSYAGNGRGGWVGSSGSNSNSKSSYYSTPQSSKNSSNGNYEPSYNQQYQNGGMTRGSYYNKGPHQVY